MELAAVIFTGLALFVSCMAWWQSRRSAKASVRSARASKVSAKAARKMTLVATEVRDVEWQPVREDGLGVYCIRNAGTTAALEVLIALDVDGERLVFEYDEIGPGELVVFELLEIRNESRVPNASNLTSRFKVSARVIWTSPAGNPGVWSGVLKGGSPRMGASAYVY